MQIIGSLILGMIITILAVTLTIFYIVVFVMGIGWLAQKLESLKNAPTQKKPVSPRVRSIS
jgi:TM2 domain-containing membrane protein YozV